MVKVLHDKPGPPKPTEKDPGMSMASLRRGCLEDFRYTIIIANDDTV